MPLRGGRSRRSISQTGSWALSFGPHKSIDSQMAAHGAFGKTSGRFFGARDPTIVGNRPGEDAPA
jgi:hypothetical protein